MADVETRSFRAKHEAVYSLPSECERYEELCLRQDHAGNVVRAIHAVLPLSRATRVLDLGAGTGKLSRLLAPLVGPIVAVDRSSPMCRVGAASLEMQPAVGFAVADQRAVPLRDGCVELVVAGWSVSAIKSEMEEWDFSKGAWVSRSCALTTHSSPSLGRRSPSMGSARAYGLARGLPTRAHVTAHLLHA